MRSARLGSLHICNFTIKVIIEHMQIYLYKFQSCYTYDNYTQSLRGISDLNP